MIFCTSATRTNKEEKEKGWHQDRKFAGQNCLHALVSVDALSGVFSASVASAMPLEPLL
jgi:hypothetical protein